MSLFVSGTWSWWRHTGGHWQVTITMLWGNKIFYLDCQLCGCLSSCHPSTLLSSYLSPELLMMDTVVYSWAQLSRMMCSWRNERNCGKGENACWIPTPMQSMDPSSVLQGNPVWMQFDAWVRYSNACSANPTKACIDAGWDNNHNTLM